MLYASDNNARSFYEFRDAAFCPSCHEKASSLSQEIFTRWLNGRMLAEASSTVRKCIIDLGAWTPLHPGTET